MMIDEERMEEFRQLLSFVEEDKPTVEYIIAEVGKAVYELGVRYCNDLISEVFIALYLGNLTGNQK